MSGMFYNSTFNGDISNWNTSKVENTYWMFACSRFNQDISRWKINKDCNTTNMLDDCPIRKEFKPMLPK